VINTLCDNLLLTCFALETRTARVEMLDEICEDIRLDWPGRRPRGGDRELAENLEIPRVYRRE
jgi:hypothetical protein